MGDRQKVLFLRESFGKPSDFRASTPRGPTDLLRDAWHASGKRTVITSVSGFFSPSFSNGMRIARDTGGLHLGQAGFDLFRNAGKHGPAGVLT